MKKIVFIVLFFTINSFVFGQEVKNSSRFELKSIDLSTGKSYLSGGFSLGLNFKSDNTTTLLTLKKDKVFLNHLYSIPKIKLGIGPSGGYFQNIPFAGVIANFSPTKFFSSLHWVGYSFGKPDSKMDINPSFLFLLNKINLKTWKFDTYYCNVKFMNFPMKHVAGVSYKHKMVKNVFVYTNVAYDFTNTEQLLQFGVIWKK